MANYHGNESSEVVLYTRGEEDEESDAWDDTALIKAYDDAVSAMKAKIALQYPEIASNPENDNSKKAKKKKKNKTKPKKKEKRHEEWNIGDLCQAVYTEDGNIYPAEIISIDERRATCTVQYLGYGNEEDQPLSSLMPHESDAVSSQDQKTETASEPEDVSPSPKQSVAPPPPALSGKRRNRKQDQHRQYSHGSGSHVLPPPPPFGHMPPPPPPLQAFQASGPQAPVFPSVPSPPPWFTDTGASDENQALYSMLISWYMSGYHTGYYQGLKHSSASGSAASGLGVYR